VNPFNGEGIAYAMETAEMAAELVHEALVKDRPGIVAMYPTLLRQRYGRYFTIGRGFVKLIGKPSAMSWATRHLLPNKRVMTFAMRMLANLSDGRDGDLNDKLLYVLERFARAA
jgi:flavin-dependent dehydrogenase